MADRIQLNEQEMDDVVGGAYNFYYDAQGAKRCDVDNVGDYRCDSEARDRLTALKLLHRGQGWTAQMYVDELVKEGHFWK